MVLVTGTDVHIDKNTTVLQPYYVIRDYCGRISNFLFLDYIIFSI